MTTIKYNNGFSEHDATMCCDDFDWYAMENCLRDASYKCFCYAENVKEQDGEFHQVVNFVKAYKAVDELLDKYFGGANK